MKMVISGQNHSVWTQPSEQTVIFWTPIQIHNFNASFCPLEGAASWSGVITKLTILCPPRPNAVNIAFFACANFEHVRPAVLWYHGAMLSMSECYIMMFWNPKVDGFEETPRQSSLIYFFSKSDANPRL